MQHQGQTPFRDDLSRPAPLACQQCRRRHLRCDAGVPVCARCASTGHPCSYIASRRGYRTNLKRKSDALSLGEEEPTAQTEWTAPVTPGTSISGIPESFVTHQCASGSSDGTRSTDSRPASSTRADFSSLNPAWHDPFGHINEDEHLADLYYTKFHSAHPILVPRTMYMTHSYPQTLRLVVQCIGSQFSTSGIAKESLWAMLKFRLSQEMPQTSTTVQVLLLAAIALHARNDPNEADSLLSRATELAIQIGMHQEPFILKYGNSNRIIEESLRRTWFELYIVDGFMAAIHNRSSFRTNTVYSTVRLPTDVDLADPGSMRKPPSLTDFDNRLFADDDINFSSATYRIEAVRILAKVLHVAGSLEVNPDELQAVDNALAAWAFHLPAEKVDVVSHDGQVDEQLFQAHFIIHSAVIYLHHPRSGLQSPAAVCPEMSCVPQDKHLSPTATQHSHSAKAMAASRGLSDLAALRTPIQHHSPFFVCGLVLAASVQLAASILHDAACMEQHRQRVALMLGALKTLGHVWAVARYHQTNVRMLAKQALHSECRQDAVHALPGVPMGHGHLGHIDPNNAWMESLVHDDMGVLPAFDMDLAHF